MNPHIAAIALLSLTGPRAGAYELQPAVPPQIEEVARPEPTIHELYAVKREDRRDDLRRRHSSPSGLPPSGPARTYRTGLIR